MKKLFLTLAMLAAMQLANAQNEVKAPAAAKSAVEKAEADTQNPKKNTKVGTWLKYGQTLKDAYNSSVGSVLRGATKSEASIILANTRPVSSNNVTLGGRSYTRDAYDIRNLYYSEDGRLAIIEVTSPVVDQALEKAVEAYSKANELDVKAQKSSDISAALDNISLAFSEEAYYAYYLGDKAKSSVYFEKAADASLRQPLNRFDSLSILNAAMTAFDVADYERAKTFYTKCYEKSYFGKDGDVYAKLGTIALFQKDTLTAAKYYEDGFSAYPNSQILCVSLINLYLGKGESPEKLFVLLDKAKSNDPKNASLYYVEGNIRKDLGQEEEAVAAYGKAVEIDPSYEFGYIGIGLIYTNRADKIAKTAASEMDDKKYEKLVADFEKTLKLSVSPFEKAFEVAKDVQLKVNIADQLKSVCYRFSEDPEYKAKYDQYKAYITENKK